MIRLFRGMAFIATVLGFIAACWGFARFAELAESYAAPAPSAHADGIVALTGGSSLRLRTGMQLLAAGQGRRLLISGVNPRIPERSIHALLDGDPRLIACCVDLGRQAEDTLGNASETAAWARLHGFRTLIIVTHDYHMPRSLVELRLAMPGVRLIARAVPTKLAHGGLWKRDLQAGLKLGGEYMKFVFILARERLLALDRKQAAASPEAPSA